MSSSNADEKFGLREAELCCMKQHEKLSAESAGNNRYPEDKFEVLTTYGPIRCRQGDFIALIWKMIECILNAEETIHDAQMQHILGILHALRLFLENGSEFLVNAIPFDFED